MSETPDDIRSAAKSVRAKLCLKGVCEFDRGCGCLDDLAEALMAERLAERERCAKIAESNNHFPGEGEYIASAIRNQD